MKKGQVWPAVGQITLLGVFVLLVVVVFQVAQSGAVGGIGDQTLQSTPLSLTPERLSGYPPPLPTLAGPEIAVIMATRVAEATAAAPMVATMVAEATGSVATRIIVPPLLPTFTPPPSGQTCYIDSLNRFSLILPPGWHSSFPPSPNAVGGATVLYNYDMENLGNEGKFPPGSLKIQISSGKLSAGQSLNEWVSNMIASATAVEPLNVTEPVPYKISKYTGLSFVFTSANFNISWLVVALSPGEDRVLTVGLMPADSSAFLEGVSLLSTLDASDGAACTLIP